MINLSKVLIKSKRKLQSIPKLPLNYKKLVIRIYRKYLRTLGYSKYLSRFLFRIVQSGIYIAFSLLLINIVNVLFTNGNNLGSFGDFIGGMLNPVFTFLMLLGLIATIVLQKNELSLARKEFTKSADALKDQNINLEYQRFENTFFTLLNFLDDCRNDIFYKSDEGNESKGRDAINDIYHHFIKSYLNTMIMKDPNYLEINTEFGIIRSGEKTVSIFEPKYKQASELKKVYDKFYANEFGDDLGQYFRTLYNILKFVDNNKNIKDKTIYTNLLRAQLSRYELLILFYNCISSLGEEKMAPLVKKYNILKHLEISELPEENREMWSNFTTAIKNH